MNLFPEACGRSSPDTDRSYRYAVSTQPFTPLRLHLSTSTDLRPSRRQTHSLCASEVVAQQPRKITSRKISSVLCDVEQSVAEHRQRP